MQVFQYFLQMIVVSAVAVSEKIILYIFLEWYVLVFDISYQKGNE